MKIGLCTGCTEYIGCPQLSYVLYFRDIKPANILAQMRGKRVTCWKIGDFGLSIETGVEMPSTVQRGTLKYRSPDDVQTNKSDVFALGLVFLEVLDPNLELFSQILNEGDIHKLLDGSRESILSEFNQVFQDIVEPMVKFRQEDRPSAGEIWESGSQIWGGNGDSAATTTV